MVNTVTAHQLGIPVFELPEGKRTPDEMKRQIESIMNDKHEMGRVAELEHQLTLPSLRGESVESVRLGRIRRSIFLRSTGAPAVAVDMAREMKDAKFWNIII